MHSRFAAMLALVSLAIISLAADWPQFYGPIRDGHSTETGLNWQWGNGGPSLAWKLDIGAGFAGPAVVNGIVYLFHRLGNEEVLSALAADSGQVKWRFAAPTRYVDDFGFDDGPRCVPVISGGRAFALGADGDLHAIDITSGKGIWHRNIRRDYAAPKGYFGVGAGPIVLGNRLLVNVGGKGTGIVAFDTSTGKELWKATDDPPGYSSPVSMMFDGQECAVFHTRTGLVIVEAASGAVKHTLPWRARIDASVNASSPIVRENAVFLTTSYSTGAILLQRTGNEWNEVWSNDRSLSCHYNTPIRVGEYLYGVDGRQEGGAARLRCVEWKSGTVKWSVDRFGTASLIAVDGGIIAVTERGDVVRFAANPERFEEQAKAKVAEGTVRAAPALADGRLFLRDEKRFYALNLKK